MTGQNVTTKLFVRDLARPVAKEQKSATERWREVGSPVGPLPALLPPGRHNSFDYRMGAVPAVGEHSEAILRELGRSSDEVAAMRAQGVI